MGRFTGVLLVSDVDGTFLSRSKAALEKNISAVEKFKAQGGLFTFATGRDFAALFEAIPDAARIANAPMIVCNGAQIYDFARGGYIYDRPVRNKRLLAEIVRQVTQKYPETGVRFSCEDSMIAPDFNEMLRRDLEGLSLDKLRLSEMPLDELINSGAKIYKCVFVDRDDAENIESIRRICETLDKSGELCFAKSYWCGLEAVDKDGSKGHAAMQLKKHTGAGVLYAIGDYENDMELLKAADYGAAPESALGQVKAAAQIITAGCDDGAVADLIDLIKT